MFLPLFDMQTVHWCFYLAPTHTQMFLTLLSPAERAGRKHDRDGGGRRGRPRGAPQDGGRGRHGGGGQGLHHGPVSELTEHGHGPAEGEGLGNRHGAKEQSRGEVLRDVDDRRRRRRRRRPHLLAQNKIL